ncbi:MAG TPA: macro domain-containing protein [Planctomycetota bacterium]
MRVVVKTGDVLDEEVDVLLCTANALLRMSGGVNGALLQRGGEAVQAELDAFLMKIGKPSVPRGSVVRTGPGPLRVKHILHVVGVDVFYETSVAVITGALRDAFAEAGRLGARTVATPALATGYGPLKVAQFAEALQGALDVAPPELRVVLRKEDDAALVRSAISGS